MLAMGFEMGRLVESAENLCEEENMCGCFFPIQQMFQRKKRLA